MKSDLEFMKEKLVFNKLQGISCFIAICNNCKIEYISVGVAGGEKVAIRDSDGWLISRVSNIEEALNYRKDYSIMLNLNTLLDLTQHNANTNTFLKYLHENGTLITK